MRRQHNFRVRQIRPANSGVSEQRQALGELPEDLMSDRAIRPPMVSPIITDFAPGTLPGGGTRAPIIGPTRAGGGWANNYKSVPYAYVSSAAGEGVRLMTANSRRAYLLIQNRSGGPVYIGYGYVPTTLNGIELTAGGSQEFAGGAPSGAFTPPEDIFILSSAAGQTVIAMEGYYLPPT